MNIADKEQVVSANNVIIAENVPKVYEAGQMSIIKSKAYGSGTLTGCLDEPIFFLSFSFPSGAAKIVFTSESGETQEIIYSHSTGAVSGGVTFNDGKVIAEDSLGNVIDITNTSVGEQIKALRTYAGTTYVTSDYGVSVGYYKDVRQARYEEGEKVGKDSEKAKIDYHFKRAKEAVNMRGGDIAMDAEIDALPEAIANIPIDASLAFYEDSEIAYQKIVPNGAEEYALLKSVGGMTYKCRNLVNIQPFTIANSSTRKTIDVNLVKGKTVTLSALIDATSAESQFFNLRLDYIVNGVTTHNSTNTVGAGSKEIAKVTVAIPDDVEKVQIIQQIGSSSRVGTAQVSNVMLAFGDDTEYEPYYEGLRDSKVTKIVSNGKNLFDLNNIIKGSFGSDGQYLNTPHVIRTSEPISVIGGETYVVSCDSSYDLRYLYFYGSENEYISSVWMDRVQSYKFTAPTDARFVNIGFEIDGATSGMVADIEAAKANSKMQLEFGSVKTEYTPYREPITYPIPEVIQNLDGWGAGVTGNYQNTLPKKTCSNIYDFNSKNYTKSVSNIITLDGVSKKITGKSGKRFYVSEYKSYDVSNTLLATTPHFTPKMWGTNDYECWLENRHLVVILPETITSVNEANVWLAEQYSNGNPVCYQYALEEPIITSIKDDIEIPSFIEVEGGGSLEFVNEHKNAVPSIIKYTTKVGN
jgi:hypothetical protein